MEFLLMNPRAPRRAGIFCGASLQRFRPILNRRCRRNSERIIEPQLGQLDHIDCEGTVELSSAEPVAPQNSGSGTGYKSAHRHASMRLATLFSRTALRNRGRFYGISTAASGTWAHTGCAEVRRSPLCIWRQEPATGSPTFPPRYA